MIDFIRFRIAAAGAAAMILALPVSATADPICLKVVTASMIRSACGVDLRVKNSDQKNLRGCTAHFEGGGSAKTGVVSMFIQNFDDERSAATYVKNMGNGAKKKTTPIQQKMSRQMRRPMVLSVKPQGGNGHAFVQTMGRTRDRAFHEFHGQAKRYRLKLYAGPSVGGTEVSCNASQLGKLGMQGLANIRRGR